jgi:hypothetical protein
LLYTEKEIAKEGTINEYSNKEALETPRIGIKELTNEKKLITPQTNTGSLPGEASTSNVNIEERREVDKKELDYELKKSIEGVEAVDKVKNKGIDVSDILFHDKEKPAIEINKDQKKIELEDINVPVEILNKTLEDHIKRKNAVFLNESQTSHERSASFNFPLSSTDKHPLNHKDNKTHINAISNKPVEKKDIVLTKEDKKVEDSTNNKLEDSKYTKSDQKSNSGIHVEEEIHEIHNEVFSTMRKHKMEDKVISGKLSDSPLVSPETSPKASIQFIPKIKPTDSHWNNRKPVLTNDKKLKLPTDLLEESLILETPNAQEGYKEDKIFSESIIQLLQAEPNDNMDSRSVKDTHTLPYSTNSQDLNTESPSKNINSPNLLSTTDIDNIEESLLVI